jgi:hypothetical protein
VKTIALRFGIDVGYRFRRFFKRLVLNYWDSDSSLAKSAVRITGISSKFALSAAGIHSAPKFFAGFADLTGLDGILTRQRSGNTKIPRAGKNTGLIDRVNVNAALRSVRAGHR